jgi:hypothetical protein
VRNDLFATAFSSAFARCTPAFFFATATAAFLSAVTLFVYGRPRSTRRFLFAYAALFIAASDLFRAAFLFRRIFLFTSSCHKYPGLFLKIESHPEMGSDLLLCATLSVNDLATVGVQNLSCHIRRIIRSEKDVRGRKFLRLSWTTQRDIGTKRGHVFRLI